MVIFVYSKKWLNSVIKHSFTERKQIMKQRIKASHARIRNSFSFFKPTKVIQLIKEAIQEWQKDKVSSLAASLATTA